MLAQYRNKFMSKITYARNGCWMWTGIVDKDGYGFFSTPKKLLRCHRVAYQLFVGPLSRRDQVMHRCDVPGCVNPSHLMRGTNETNREDSVCKRRHAHGTRHGNAKLTETIVKAIRSRYMPGVVSLKELSQEFDVHESLIWQVVRLKGWRHVL